ncbi:YceI family protein [Halioxenophilus sp. WMMB6]|uniref:YceI family protein n=1 Tax=Halioxenophilus sp. WMMB6 TaxID=3073815 RepID=UPI00295E9A43|nr:YceI family protein [Halioxenophilus sp. WMMB6]
MKRTLVGALFFLAALSANAAEYQLDTAHTQIFFTVSHLGFSHSTGQFIDFDGKFNFDEADFSKGSAEVTIKTASIDLSNHEKWIGHVSSPDFFDVEKFPTMTFKSTGVTQTGPKTMDVAGDLTIKGITKPVVLAVTFNKAGKAFGAERAGFSATTTIDRTDYGIKYGVPGVGAEVSIHIEVEGSQN